MAHHTSSNPNEFILPDLGEGVAEAELIKWRVTVGQTVKEHDILADMETDKALVEVPSPRGGTITGLHGAEGEIIKVGSVLVSFGAAGVAAVEPKPAMGGTSSLTAGASRAPDTSHAPSKTPPGSKPGNVDNCDMGGQIAGNLPKTTVGAEAMNGSHAAPADAGTVVGKVGGSLEGVTAEAGKALATPAVRRLARDLGVDIDAVTGTGIGGRVTDKDVRTAAEGGASASPPRRGGASGEVPSAPAPAVRPAPIPAPRPTPTAATPRQDDTGIYAAASVRSASSAPGADETTRIPFRGVRRTIANRLHQSVSTAVHFTVMDEADVTLLEGLRKKLAGASGEKVSFLPFVAAAVCRCLAGEFKEFNSTTDDEKSEIVRHRAVHIGIATDTDNGLMVPVIRDCDKLGVLEIGRHIAHVAESARNRSAPREMLSGSTFTISNVGSHAGRFATPIINYPECGILAVGRARDGVVVNRGMLGVGKVLPLSLACDHRVVDGAAAALMLARIVEMLGKPEDLLGPARG